MKTTMAVAVILAAIGISGQWLVEPAGAAQPPGVTGIITAVGSDSISLKRGSAEPVTVKINSATVIKVLGKPVSGASELKAGMSAIAIGDHLSTGQPATEIRAYPPQTGTGHTPQPNPTPAQPGGVSGIITAVGSDSISLKLNHDQAVTVKINSATVIKVLGKPVSGASELKAGMRAMVIGNHLSMGQPATEIRAYPVTK